MHSEGRLILAAWMRQFGLVLWMYLATLALAVHALSAAGPGTARTLMILAPIVPGLALIWLSVRTYRRSDEFIRLRILQAASLAAVVMAVFALVYFFLELLGFPRLSTAWISNIGWAVFVTQIIRLIASKQ